MTGPGRKDIPADPEGLARQDINKQHAEWAAQWTPRPDVAAAWLFRRIKRGTTQTCTGRGVLPA